MGDLEGKVGVVTGGPVGAAIGRRFGHEGMKVVLADVQAGPLDALVRRLRDEGIDAVGVVTDVATWPRSPAAGSSPSTIDVVCNNAGTGGVSEGFMWDHDLADWRWGIDVNVLGVIHGIKAFVPILLEQGSGHVVNTCSGARRDR